MDEQNNSGNSSTLTTSDLGAIRHFHDSVKAGNNWYISLLESIGMWQSHEETYNGRHYTYLVSNEALDWLLLAERIIESGGNIVSDEEKGSVFIKKRTPFGFIQRTILSVHGRKQNIVNSSITFTVSR